MAGAAPGPKRALGHIIEKCQSPAHVIMIDDERKVCRIKETVYLITNRNRLIELTITAE